MRAYLLTLSGTCLIVVLAVVALNLVIDPYRILHPLQGEFAIEPDSRAAKVNYLAHTCGRYNAYIMGDSRSMPLTGEDLPAAQGLRFYNLSTPSENIHSMLPRLQFLLDRGCPVSAVVFDVSLDALLGPGDPRRFGLARRESPRLTGSGSLAFYGAFLVSAQPLLDDIARHWHPNTRRVAYFEDGHADYLWSMSDGAAFRTASCGASEVSAEKLAFLAGYLPDLQRFAQLAGQHHFSALVWIAPVNRWERPLIQQPPVAQFIQKLHAVDGLHIVEPDWDSVVLADYRYWHDCGHFRHEVFDRLIATAIGPVLGR